MHSQISGDFSNLEILTNRVSQLPYLSSWVPSQGKVNPFALLSLGVILGRIDDRSFNPLLELIGESLNKNESIDSDKLSELGAAALIRPWSEKITLIPRSNEIRTPDICAFIDGVGVEVEVTSAARKDEQIRRSEFTSALQNKIVNLSLGGHVSVYFIDSLSAQEEQALLTAASKLKIGNSAQVENRWYLHLGMPNANGVFSISSNPPTWWPEQCATPASMRSSVVMNGGQPTTNASAEIRWTLSTKSYINPLSKKAERIQGTSMAPFLIALDATSLPGALKWYRDNLDGYWKIWSQVSGVLLFQRATLGFNALNWEYELLVNPESNIPLPKSFVGDGRKGVWSEKF